MLTLVTAFLNLLSILHPTSRFLLQPFGLHLAFTEHQYEVSLVYFSALPLWNSRVHIREASCYNQTIPSPVWTEISPLWSWNYKSHSRTWDVVYTALFPNVFPECEYEYFVGAGVIWSNVYRFTVRTPYDVLSPTESDVEHVPDFVVFGDMGIGWSTLATRQLMLGFINTQAIDGILHLGDIAYNLDSYAAAIPKAYFSELEPITSRVPYMVLPGNHERFHNFTQYKTLFRMPVNPANAGSNMYYSFNYGKAHFLLFSSDILLDALDPYEKAIHLDWIQEDLETANKYRDVVPWLVVLSHKPYYCQVDYRISRDPDDDKTPGYNKDCSYRAERVKAILEELFYKANVDLVLTGHVHNYQRTTPIYNNLTVPSEYDDLHTHINTKAPVFIVSGAAGSREGNDPNSSTPQSWCLFQSRERGVGRLRVMNSTHLYWEQWSALKNKTIDYLWLIKDRIKY